MKRLQFPEGKAFAFSIFDDTDHATVPNVKPIYDLLLTQQILTTKSVWVYPTNDTRNSFCNSQTLADSQYLDFIRYLSNNGFEIAFHNASMASSPRELTLLALQRFRELLGYYPRAHTNHVSNTENLYWGPERLDTAVLKLLMGIKRKSSNFAGHIPESPYFWGDICQRNITYVRNFVFREINLMRINPTIPYKDPKRPFVNYWFSSSEGGDVNSFNQLLSSRNQDRLESEGGVCIVYTHFANGFAQGGKVHPKTKKLLLELSNRNGWFVPVSTLLDYLCSQHMCTTLSPLERRRMEIRWAMTKLLSGTS